MAFLGLGLGDASDPNVLEGLIKETAGADVRILLSHYPDVLHYARKRPVALLLSGHTHGGQVCLPWLGPVVTMSTVPRSIAVGGLHRVDDLQVRS